MAFRLRFFEINLSRRAKGLRLDYGSAQEHSARLKD